MAQDFAKQRSNPDVGKRRRAVSTTAPPPGNANWSWFFSGLMSGVIISIAAYLALQRLEANAGDDPLAVEAGAGPEEQPTFNFYEVLSEAEVAVTVPGAENAGAETGAVSSTAAAAGLPSAQVVASATEAKPELYLLQAGSFQNQEDAESQRARILLLNMSASVVEGIVGGRTHYRVQVGPFAGRESADAARNLLSGNDIESIFLKLAP